MAASICVFAMWLRLNCTLIATHCALGSYLSANNNDVNTFCDFFKDAGITWPQLRSIAINVREVPFDCLRAVLRVLCLSARIGEGRVECHNFSKATTILWKGSRRWLDWTFRGNWTLDLLEGILSSRKISPLGKFSKGSGGEEGSGLFITGAPREQLITDWPLTRRLRKDTAARGKFDSSFKCVLEPFFFPSRKEEFLRRLDLGQIWELVQQNFVTATFRFLPRKKTCVAGNE